MFPELSTPVAVVDLDRFERNVARGATRAAELAVGLRPHAKTVKSPELMAFVVEAGVVGLTVSTLREVETLRHLVGDFLYGVPVAEGKRRRVLEALDAEDVRLTLVVDSVDGLAGVPRDPRVDVAIEVDCDGRRGGVDPEGADLLAIAEAAGDRLRGVMTHAGGSYADPPAEMAVVERQAVTRAADRLRSAGHVVDMVSVGSTPTFFAVDHLRGVTEARPGVYLFGDESQVALGTGDAGTVALTVLATVIGVRDGTAIIDSGWSALSQDRGVAGLGDCGVGIVDGHSDLVVFAATQEHGMVRCRDGGDTRLRVGDRIRVRPLHACATAEMHARLATVRGSQVVGSVERPRGW